jgi:hypothetical protein
VSNDDLWNRFALSFVFVIPQVRGFAPIGMLEYWNIGKMGFGILECWVNGIIVLTIKLKMDDILLNTKIDRIP